jgi:RNA recognition motif-containing protein
VSVADVLRLFVGNVPFSATAPDLISHFCGHGFHISDVDILRDKHGRGRGVAFVTMENISEAERAIAEMDRQPLLGRELRVAWPKRRSGEDVPPDEPAKSHRLAGGYTRIFLGNLAYRTSEDELAAHIASALMGDVGPVRTVKSTRQGEARYGFADVPDADVERVLRLDGVALNGRALRIQVAGRQE